MKRKEKEEEGEEKKTSRTDKITRSPFRISHCVQYIYIFLLNCYAFLVIKQRPNTQYYRAPGTGHRARGTENQSFISSPNENVNDKSNETKVSTIML